jgi:uncharacterized membrane protein required for colicin V production
MSITSYTDIVIAICILVSVLVGYHRGFLVTIARIVAMVASYIGAILAAEMLKKTLAQTLFVPMIRQGLGNGAFADLAQEALLQTAEGIAYSVVFFVVFALLQFVLLRAIHVLKLVDHIPVLGTMNKLAGGVLGFFGVFILCILLGRVFFTYVPDSLRSQWGFTGKAVQQTVLLNAFVPDEAGKDKP